MCSDPQWPGHFLGYTEGFQKVCGVRGSLCQGLCIFAHEHMSARESVMFNRFSKGFCPQIGSGVVLRNHSERSYRVKSSPKGVRLGRTEGPPAGRKQGHPQAEAVTHRVVPVLEARITEQSDGDDNNG